MKMNGKIRIIALLASLMLAGGNIFAQTKITGTVKDDTGAPVVGAVVQSDASNAAVVGSDGKYSINVSAKATKLTVSCLGYATQSQDIGKRGVIDFVMEPDAVALEETVVVGYGSMRKSDLTGSVTSVKIDDHQADVSSSLDQLLVGRAAGVQVVSNSASPDAGVSIRIRGLSSLQSGSEPLYVVDGIIMSEAGSATMLKGTANEGNDEAVNSLAGINPRDIANIEVLKDASATAIYGAEGANGVILITTKSATTDRPKIEYSAGVDFAQRYRKIDMLDVYGYAELKKAQGRSINLIFEDTVNLKGLKVEPIDWQDYMMHDAWGQRHYFNISGKPKNLMYNVSVGYLKKDGVVMNTSNEQFTARANVERTISKKLKIGTRTNYAYTGSKLSQGLNSSTLDAQTSIMRSMIISRPFKTILDDEEATTDEDRYLPDRWMSDFQSGRQEYRVSPSMWGTYKILPWLTFRSTLGGDYRSSRRFKWKGDKVNSGPEGSIGTVAEIETLRWNWDNTLQFDTKLGSAGYHNISGTVGMAMAKASVGTQTTTGYGIIQKSAQIDNLNASVNTQFGYDENSFSTLSFISRLIYNYRNRYVLTSTFRVDGSSKFLGKNKYAAFPSFAFAWRINEEPWFDVNFISMAKLRLGWGQVGNASVSSYQTMALYNNVYGPDHTPGNASQMTVGIVGANIANPYLRWETSQQTNLGLDLSLWHGRLTLTSDAYDKNTYDLLFRKKIAISSGFSEMWVNQGSLRNRGLEFAIDAVPLKTGLIEWSIGGNLSLNRGIIESLGKGAEGGYIYLSKDDCRFCNYYLGAQVATGSYCAYPANAFIEGQPIGLFYGWKTDGIIQQGETGPQPTQGVDAGPGFIKFVDMDGNGYIDTNDRTIIGDPNPDFTYGFNTRLSVWNFTLGVSFAGSYGNDIANINLVQENNLGSQTMNIRREAFEKRWTPENPGNRYPSIESLYGGNGTSQLRYFTDRLLEDGSFLRLSNVSLSFHVPIKEKAFIKGLDLTVSGNNLYVWTKYSGYDPDVNSFGTLNKMGIDFGSYPSARIYSFDVKLTF